MRVSQRYPAVRAAPLLCQAVRQGLASCVSSQVPHQLGKISNVAVSRDSVLGTVPACNPAVTPSHLCPALSACQQHARSVTATVLSAREVYNGAASRPALAAEDSAGLLARGLPGKSSRRRTSFCKTSVELRIPAVIS